MNRFARTRDDHSRESAEDYVELVLTLIEDNGEARVTDLADKLGISAVTVSQTLKRLSTQGFVRAEPYRSVFLTDEGTALAHMVRKRHQIVLDFLLALGISRQTAEHDSEGIEHHVSPETLDALERFLNRPNENRP